eukprot:Pgem_evm1s14482
MTVKKLIQVEIVSDIICPWCWVGKRNIETAIESSKDLYDVQVKWLPFQLRPNTPLEGRVKTDPPEERVGARLKEVGLRHNINFTGLCDRVPNTAKAHTLLHYAQEYADLKTQNHIQEALFHGYFTDGKFPGDVDFLVAVANEYGLDKNKVREYINSEEANTTVQQFSTFNSYNGISGVPFFIMNGQQMFSGGQPPENILEAFSRAPTYKSDWPWSSRFKKNHKIV